MLKIRQSSRNGFAVFFIVATIGAAMLIMAYSAVFLGLGELDMGYTAQKGTEAFSAADGCIEEALRRIRLNANYGIGAGTINLTLSNGSCAIDITDLGGNQRRIIAKGTVNDYNKKIQTEITLSGDRIIINSWEEISI